MKKIVLRHRANDFILTIGLVKTDGYSRDKVKCFLVDDKGNESDWVMPPPGSFDKVAHLLALNYTMLVAIAKTLEEKL